jgi:hypothetical protein
MKCPGRDLIWQCRVFLADHALQHSGGLPFHWIVFHVEGSYGYALDLMESCCFEGWVFLVLQWWERYLAATKSWCPRIVSASAWECKNIKRWTLISTWRIHSYDLVGVYKL